MASSGSNALNPMDDAIKFKEFLINYFKSCFEKDKTTLISLKDLSELTSNSPYTFFLREYFKIDSRSLLKRLHMFLLTYPDQFVVNYESGLVRLTNDEEHEPKYLCESLIDRCHEFLIFCLSLQASFLIPIKQVHNYLKYAALDVENHLNDYDYFLKFMQSRVDLYYIQDDHVCQKNVQKKMERKNFVLNKDEQVELDDRLLCKTEFVHNLKTGKRVMDYIQSKVNCIAYDSEGTHLGNIEGSLTLVQIAFLDKKPIQLSQSTILENIRVYIFDILKCEELIQQCIVPILSNDKIIKVMHDLKNDFSALKLNYNVKEIKNVFDTSKLYYKLTKSPTNGLHTIYEEITGLHGYNFKPKMRRLYLENDRIWEKRPVTSFLQFYAAFDTLCLIYIYLYLEEKFVLKPTMYIDKIDNTDQIVLNSSCVDEDGDYYNMPDESNGKKKKKKGPKQPPSYIYKKTPEELEELRKKVEYLEKVARSEIDD